MQQKSDLETKLDHPKYNLNTITHELVQNMEKRDDFIQEREHRIQLEG
jgi:hypothetical protein